MSDDGKSAYMNASDEAKKVYATQMTAYNLTLVEPVANATIVGVPSGSSSSSDSSDSSDSDSDDDVVQKAVIPTVVTKPKPVKKVPIVASTPAPAASKPKKAKHAVVATPAAIVPQALATPSAFVSTPSTDTGEKKKKKKKREREE